MHSRWSSPAAPVQSWALRCRRNALGCRRHPDNVRKLGPATLKRRRFARWNRSPLVAAARGQAADASRSAKLNRAV